MNHKVDAITNGVLGFALFFFLAILGYAGVHIFASDWHPPLGRYYALAGGIGAIACLFALRLHAELKRNVALLVFSTFSAIYLCEWGLLIVSGFSPKDPGLDAIAGRAKLAETNGVAFDSRTRLQVVSDLAEDGTEAYPAIFPNAFIGSDSIPSDGEYLFPLGGVSLSTTVLCNESGQYVCYMSDEFGFNNPTGLFDDGNIDIMLVGDSFAQGMCVPQHNNTAGRIMAMGYRVLSVGMGGNGPLLNLAAIREYVEPIAPAVTVWMHYENDVPNLERDRTSGFLMRYLDREFRQNLIGRQDEVDHLLRAYLERRMAAGQGREPTELGDKEESLLAVVKLRRLRTILGIAPNAYTPSFELLESVLKTAHEATLSHGGRMYFVYLPSWEALSGEFARGDSVHRDQVLDVARRLGLPIIDVEQTFVTHPDPLSLFPFRARGHFTEDGYDLVATEIVKRIEHDR